MKAVWALALPETVLGPGMSTMWALQNSEEVTDWKKVSSIMIYNKIVKNKIYEYKFVEVSSIIDKTKRQVLFVSHWFSKKNCFVHIISVYNSFFFVSNILNMLFHMSHSSLPIPPSSRRNWKKLKHEKESNLYWIFLFIDQWKRFEEQNQIPNICFI